MVNSGKDKFLSSTPSDINKVLKSEEVYHNYKIESYKRFWEQLKWNPITYFIIGIFIACIVCLGVSYDWNWKVMIHKSFGYLLTALITAVVEYCIIKIIEKNDKTN